MLCSYFAQDHMFGASFPFTCSVLHSHSHVRSFIPTPMFGPSFPLPCSVGGPLVHGNTAPVTTTPPPHPPPPSHQGGGAGVATSFLTGNRTWEWEEFRSCDWEHIYENKALSLY